MKFYFLVESLIKRNLSNFYFHFNQRERARKGKKNSNLLMAEAILFYEGLIQELKILSQEALLKLMSFHLCVLNVCQLWFPFREYPC